ncbi:hypothetical protein FE783_27360 [Paenibacillus mesophilus]|uniref:hypothetical protein n=1 Tax=Paenibacillus mesophilus TaxID=2582849 RepID=UPI00110F11E2|nr:hypothetical protein [Paenibacillus mesophilus]TMV46140.1 hypothetical protein FE783_27360 [Paenibacillus mesophilus]
MVNNREPFPNDSSDVQKEIKTIGEVAAENDITNVEEQGRYFTESASKHQYLKSNASIVEHLLTNKIEKEKSHEMNNN